MPVLYDHGKKLDVSRDVGGGMYYRVSEEGKDDWSLVYRVNYYNNVQNGDFENPIMCTPGESGALFPFNASNIRMDIRGCIGKQQDQAGIPTSTLIRLVMILKLLMVEI